MNELTRPEPERTNVTVRPESAPAITEGPGALLGAIIQVAKDPAIDVTKLQALLQMQERLEDRQAEERFNDALAAAQAEMGPIVRDKTNNQTSSKYATLFRINEIIRPIYTRIGFSLAFGQEAIEGNKVRIICDVSLGRHTRRYHMDAPPDTLGPKGNPTKTELHGLGSTMTYLRNKLTCGIFNLVLRDEDDDGVRGGMKFIGDDQVDEIRSMLKQAGRQEGPFLDRMFGGTVRSVEEIKSDALLPVKNTLLGIIQQQKKAQG